MSLLLLLGQSEAATEDVPNFIPLWGGIHASLPDPDGTIGPADRAHLAFTYPDLYDDVDAPPIGVGLVRFVAQDRSDGLLGVNRAAERVSGAQRLGVSSSQRNGGMAAHDRGQKIRV